jgi:UDP-N-acetylglucosamine--N-acetylmuramyl-(pentapeptide) pyrophosphoryl-undecaprenol N-acetylglucosamine transferase
MSKLRVLIFPLLVIQIIGLIIKHRPTAILAMGGSICIPFAMVGCLLRIPVIAFEQNVIPGRAIRLIQYFVKKIITSFEATKDYLKVTKKIKCMGNPIRSSYPTTDDLPQEWHEISGKTILIIGGSQGALAVNKFIDTQREQLLKNGWNIIHLTGQRHFKNNGTSYVEKINDGIYLAMPFLINMRIAYKKATVVMCRAGATTLAELKAYQIPALLVPFPHAMDNHQFVNAVEFSKQYNFVEVIDQGALSSINLLAKAESISQKNVLKIESDSSDHVKYICEFIKTYLE